MVKKSCPFFAENMIIKSIYTRYSMLAFKEFKLILDFSRGLFTFRLKGTRGLLYTVKSDFFDIAAEYIKW